MWLYLSLLEIYSSVISNHLTLFTSMKLVSPSPYVGVSSVDGACLVTLVESRVCSEHRLSSGDCHQPPLMGAPGMHACLVIGGLGAPGLGAALLWKLCFSQVHGHQRTAGLQLGGSSAEREGLE